MKRKKDRTGETNLNKRGEKMTIIAYRCYEDIDVQFEDDIISYNKSYGSFKNGSIKHPFRYEESFAYHIEVELGLNLDDIWNWELNKVNPKEISKQSNKKVWLYCLENDYHNYNKKGDKIGYKITCSHFYNGRRCGYCNRHNKAHYKDSLAYNYPNIAKMIAIPENNLIFDDCYNISYGSHKKYYFKCSDCGNISKNKKILDNVVKRRFSCEICSDGISIPNKFMANILKQLNEDFIAELSSKKFSDKNYFYYDFYLPRINSIIEINGIQHYENSARGRTLEQEQMNDLFKYKCAKNHINNYIIIDCRYSTLEWLKENIIKELNDYFDLSNIDWKLAWEESQSSLCVKTWELWNNKYKVIDIANKMNISDDVVRKYLKIGEECNKCLYKKINNIK
jgi:hypothetical protein